jgi:hypothetical protein
MKKNDEKLIDITYSRLKNAEKIEDIICLSVLIATNKLPYNATIEDAEEYYINIRDCNNCMINNTCLACIINQ